MLTERMAIQMLVVGDWLRQDLDSAAASLRAMGYRGLELYGPSERLSPEDARRLRGAGLPAVSRHVEWAELQPDRFEATVRYLQSVACPLAVVPCLGGEWHIGHGPAEECRDVWLRYAEALNALCGRLAERGIRLGYHTHDHEFTTRYGGQTVFELLFGSLRPEVALELDSGRALKAGADCAVALRSQPGRDVLLHLKPYAPETGYDSFLGAPGDANDVPALLAACAREPLWVIVESESTAYDGRESTRRNAAYLRGLSA